MCLVVSGSYFHVLAKLTVKVKVSDQGLADTVSIKFVLKGVYASCGRKTEDVTADPRDKVLQGKDAGLLCGTPVLTVCDN